MSVEVIREGRVGIVRLSRAEKLNAVTPEMADALFDAFAALDADDDIRVVVLTGAGERAFCAGSDVRELDHYETPWMFRNRRDYCDSVRRCHKPVIGAINGLAYGGGLELALSADVRLASESAAFCAAEIKLGWIGGGGVTYMLVHNIGASNAALMLLTGDPIDANQAMTWGLVSSVHRPEELEPAAMALAARIAANAPIAARTAKDNLNAAYAMPREMAVAYERDLQTICLGTEDAAEGRAAFRERRSPDFRGR